MNTILYDSLTLTKTSSHQISISLEVIDKSSVTSRVIWQKTLPLYGVIVLIFLSMPFLFLLMLWTIVSSLVALFTVSKPEPTYEEAKEWFKQKKGYLANLSEEEKRRIGEGKDLPLGL